MCIEKTACTTNTFKEISEGLYECVKNCSDQFFTKEFDKTDKRTYTYCYAECPSGYIFYGDSNKKECKKTCDSKIYSVDTETDKICQTTCESKYYLGDYSIVGYEMYFKCITADECT